MNPRAVSVAEYLARLEPERRAVIADLLALSARVLTGWTAVVEYGMPGFRRGKDVIGFAAQKNYYAFYICEPVSFLDAYRARLGKLDCGKSCIRFKKPGDFPNALLEEILTARRDLPPT